MDLAEAGIVLKCLCGAGMSSDIGNVLFDDRGKIKIGRLPVHCPVCGAIYRYGERLKYDLVPLDIKAARDRNSKGRYPRSSYEESTLVSAIPG